MTATAPADSGLTALYTDPGHEPTFDEWNWLVREAGVAYKRELAARTVFESELSGMNTYIVMSMMEDYLRVPERIRTIRRHPSATELVARDLAVGNKRSFINLAAMPLHLPHRTGTVRRPRRADPGRRPGRPAGGAALLARGQYRHAH